MSDKIPNKAVQFKMESSVSEVKLLFDDEISRCLEVDSTLQTLSFFLFSSKLSSEYKRIFVGPFLECEFIFSGFLGL